MKWVYVVLIIILYMIISAYMSKFDWGRGGDSMEIIRGGAEK